jgi:hypothetical protein
MCVSTHDTDCDWRRIQRQLRKYIMETQDWHITAQVTWIPGIIASARSNPTRRPPRWSVAEGSRQEQEESVEDRPLRRMEEKGDSGQAKSA